MHIIKLLLAFLFVASPVWAGGVLTPAAGPISSASTLYDYTTSLKIQDDFCGGSNSSGAIGTMGWVTGGGRESERTHSPVADGRRTIRSAYVYSISQ